MTVNEIRKLLGHDPFQPFRVRLSSGDYYDIRNPALAVPMNREIFVALPDGDRWVFIPYIHVAAVETLGNGHNGKPRKR